MILLTRVAVHGHVNYQSLKGVMVKARATAGRNVDSIGKDVQLPAQVEQQW